MRGSSEGMSNGNLRAGSFNALFFGRITSYDNVLCLCREPEELSRGSHSILGGCRTLRRWSLLWSLQAFVVCFWGLGIMPTVFFLWLSVHERNVFLTTHSGPRCV